MSSVHDSTHRQRVVSLGRVVKAYKSSGSFHNHSSETVDVRKFYQGCGHTVHNGSLYFHIAGTSSIARQAIPFVCRPTRMLSTVIPASCVEDRQNVNVYIIFADSTCRPRGCTPCTSTTLCTTTSPTCWPTPRPTSRWRRTRTACG